MLKSRSDRYAAVSAPLSGVGPVRESRLPVPTPTGAK